MAVVDEFSPSPPCYSIPFGVGFAAAFSQFLLEKHQAATDPLALSRLTVWVPSRRAAMALENALVAARPQGLILPNIQPMALTEEDVEHLLFDDSSLLPDTFPPVPEVTRLVYLAQQVLLWQKAAGLQKGLSSDQGMRQAYSSALSLISFSDRLVAQKIPFTALQNLAPADVASHWRQSLDFLKIVFEFYPQWLQENHAADPATLKVLRLEEQARFYLETPPEHPVYFAGFADTTPHGLTLMEALVATGQAHFVFEGVAPSLVAHTLPPTHPQYGINKLLKHFGVEAVKLLKPLSAQAELLQLSQLPAGATHAWQNAVLAPEAAEKMHLLEAPTPSLEAEAIALYMRHTLEEPHKTCALVTADRSLAARVADRLRTFGLYVNDSAGRPLLTTTAGSFFMLVAAVAEKGFPPAKLAQLLTHPFARGSCSKKDWKKATRLFEAYILRGQRPNYGLKGLQEKRAVLENLTEEEAQAIDKVLNLLAEVFRPISNQKKPQKAADWVKAHILTAQKLATLEDGSGTDSFFKQEDGQALFSQLESFISHKNAAESMYFTEYLALLEACFGQVTVRTTHTQHPRLFIWGPLEARLQHADRVIIGGLNEGTWPNPPTPDPWISREMGQSLGLPPPEVTVGLNAHDFCALAATPEVFLTRSLEEGGVPTVPSRYLLRLKAVLSSHGDSLKAAQKRGERWLQYATERLGFLHQKPLPAQAPMFTVPKAALPQVWSPSALATLMTCPYKLYAQKMLGALPLPPFDEAPDAATKGDLIHTCFEAFYKTTSGLPPAFEGVVTEENKTAALAHLKEIATAVFAKLPHGPSRVVWLSRFQLAAEAFIDQEVAHTKAGRKPWQVEETAQTALHGLSFKARADRIDQTPEGFVVMDYKTGSVPTLKDVLSGKAPQLAVEALLLEEGGFGQKGLKAVGVEYWKVGHAKAPFQRPRAFLGGKMEELLAHTHIGLKELSAVLGKDHVPMPARPSIAACRWCEYAGICRQKEWAVNAEEEEDAV